MSRFVQVMLVGAMVAGGSAYIGQAANPQAVSPPPVTSIDQKIGSATLRRYHHSDQGTRIMPAAFLQSLRTADGKSRIMSPIIFANGISCGRRTGGRPQSIRMAHWLHGERSGGK